MTDLFVVVVVVVARWAVQPLCRNFFI